MRWSLGGRRIFGLGWLTLGILAASAGPVRADGPEAPDRFSRGNSHVGVLGGYAFSLERYDGTRDVDDVRYAATVSDWGIGLSDPVGGDAWYRGNWEMLVEGMLLIETEPSSGHAGGGAILLRYNWLRHERFVPFVSAGAGILDFDFDLASQRDGFAFSLQAGVGSHVFVTRRLAITGEWRYQHISNAGTGSPNSGLDMSGFFLGTTWFLD